MPASSPSPFQQLSRKIAYSQIGVAFFSRFLPTLDRLVLEFTKGRQTFAGITTGVPIIFLTTTGAKSGAPRAVPLIPIHDPDDPKTIGLIGTNWGRKAMPAWYYNLRANPTVTGILKGKLHKFSAREAERLEYDRFWDIAVEVYFGYAVYRKRIQHRRIPIMMLTVID